MGSLATLRARHNDLLDRARAAYERGDPDEYQRLRQLAGQVFDAYQAAREAAGLRRLA